MRSQRFIHTMLSLVLFGGMALLGILAAAFAGIVSNFVQTQTSYPTETLFYFITMLSLAIFVLAIFAIFRYLYLEGYLNADWLELVGKAILIGTTSLSLTVIMNYYYQKYIQQGFSSQAFFFFLVAGIPLIVAILCYEWFWSTTLRIQARLYPILDEQLKTQTRLDEDQLRDLYTKQYKGERPILSPTIRWVMAHYVIDNTDRQLETKKPFLALEGNSNLWAILRDESAKLAKTAQCEAVEMSREDQQWVFMGKWLSKRDEMDYFLLVELAKEPDGLLEGVWANLKMHLDHLRNLAQQNGKLDPDDTLLLTRLEAIMDLKPSSTAPAPAQAAASSGNNTFERDEQLNLVDRWLNHNSPTAFASLMLKARGKDGLLLDTWQKIQDEHDRLRKKFTLYQALSPQERETYRNIIAIRDEKDKVKQTTP